MPPAFTFPWPTLAGPQVCRQHSAEHTRLESSRLDSHPRPGMSEGGCEPLSGPRLGMAL